MSSPYRNLDDLVGQRCFRFVVSAPEWGPGVFVGWGEFAGRSLGRGVIPSDA